MTGIELRSIFEKAECKAKALHLCYYFGPFLIFSNSFCILLTHFAFIFILLRFFVVIVVVVVIVVGGGGGVHTQ